LHIDHFRRGANFELDIQFRGLGDPHRHADTFGSLKTGSVGLDAIRTRRQQRNTVDAVTASILIRRRTEPQDVVGRDASPRREMPHRVRLNELLISVKS
jgi:hypothetical protein